MRAWMAAAAMVLAGGAEAATSLYTYTGNELVLDESTCSIACPQPVELGTIEMSFTLNPDFYDVGDIVSFSFYESDRDGSAQIIVTGTTGTVSATYEGFAEPDTPEVAAFNALYKPLNATGPFATGSGMTCMEVQFDPAGQIVYSAGVLNVFSSSCEYAGSFLAHDLLIGDFARQSEEYRAPPGTWSVALIPLPASATLLLGALAALITAGAARRRQA